MKILLVHNYYNSKVPSGEKQVFEFERELLLQHGHTVREFVRHSDEIRRQGMYGIVKGALATPWNPWSVAAIRQVVKEFQPDVVHVHNTFPLLSAGIFSVIGGLAARVFTLHNYRLFCANGLMFRKNRVCTDCLDQHSSWPALWHGCYRNSRLATLPLAFSVGLHRALRTWSRHVDAFIVLTDFQQKRMVAAGLSASIVHVKPNFYLENSVTIPWAMRRPTVVFVGRLTTEKGVMTLVRAWLLWGAAAPELRIIGDGDLRDELELLAATAPETPIRFLGKLASEAARAEIAQARLLVVPSEWYEVFTIVILEAFAFGTPVAVSAIGVLSSIVRPDENGVLFTPGDPQSLLATVQRAWNTPGMLEQIGRGARIEYETKYTASINYHMLMEIYQQAIIVSQEREKRKMSKPAGSLGMVSKMIFNKMLK